MHGWQDVTNPILFQAFEWYLHSDGDHWRQLGGKVPALRSMGVDIVWIPPACKAGSPSSNGYDSYDLFDLGEFDQRGSVRTKWGTKEDLVSLLETCNKHGVYVILDAVLNHKAHADRPELSTAVLVDDKDRRRELTKPREIRSWTAFDFPGRGDRYSSMKYSWKSFTGVDYDAKTRQKGIYKFVGPEKGGWARDVSPELGNFDYLMFADLDHAQSDVRDDILNWGTWVGSTLKINGMRLDACKHISRCFLRSFFHHLTSTVGKEWFFVAEYWDAKVETLTSLIRFFEKRVSFFDVPLVYNLSAASKNPHHFDLRRVFKGTLCGTCPSNAVTFVANHDTQATQALAAPVEPWFVPHAYSLILLRANAGIPCVFWGDIYGTAGPQPRLPACGGNLYKLMVARKRFAFGPQREYFDDPFCIGWTRLGEVGKGATEGYDGGGGLAVLLSSASTKAYKSMFVGKDHAGEKWQDTLGWPSGCDSLPIAIDEKGWGMFAVGPKTAAIFVNEKHLIT